MLKISVLFTLVSVSAANADSTQKFLVETAGADNGTMVATCSIPQGLFPHIIGLQGLDAYVASNQPDFNSGYRTETAFWFGNGAPLVLAQDHAITTNDTVAQACAAQESGTATPEQIATIENAANAGKLWWKVKAQNENTPVTGYVSAEYVGFTPFDQWADRFGPKLGKTDENHSEPERIIAIIDPDTTHARMTTEPLAYYSVGYCAEFSPGAASHATTEELDETINKGIWKECGSEIEDRSPHISRAMNCEQELRFYEDGTPLDIKDIISAGGASASWAGSITRLCPNTVKTLAKEACAAGDSDACGNEWDYELTTICQPEEYTEFSCQIDGRNEFLSICAKDGYRSYVYGKDAQNLDLRIRQQIPAEEYSPYFDSGLPDPLVFKNKDYYYRLNGPVGDWGRHNIEVFRNQIDPNHLVATRQCR